MGRLSHENPLQIDEATMRVRLEQRIQSRSISERQIVSEVGHTQAKKQTSSLISVKLSNANVEAPTIHHFEALHYLDFSVHPRHYQDGRYNEAYSKSGEPNLA